MNKTMLEGEVREGLISLTGKFEEYGQFTFNQLWELLPYLNKEGLIRLNSKIKDIRESNEI